ncbi:uncharacterized protein LOC128992174 [Macrosteles quadrilineatus]|uniref:uncharacterized protein LOC128992174 n=1 Tax=Macrosteles quadrilineatus TaxID=74068 RepID=UPI0023E293F6|nr:uncharacterized protein LOC128992174 [Macrosteles quadrilineatus]
MAGGELRRSYTQMDFSLNRVNIRHPMPQFFHQQPNLQIRDPRRRFSHMPSNKKHPTLEVYRPPSVRHEGMGMGQKSLNVHAPEFTMNRVQPSRSTSSVMMNGYGMMAGPSYGGKSPMMMPLQQSKSSGNVLHVVQPSPITANNIQPLTATPRAVHFQEPPVKHKSPGTGLKRSKSLSATDTLRGSSPTSSTIGGGDLGMGTFTEDIRKDLYQAIKDPNEMLARSLMSLANVIVERALSDRNYAVHAAKVCINVIEKEKKGTFLESLMNTCQLSFQERDKLLRSPTGGRYRCYMNFLDEMYVQLKRSTAQLKTHYDGFPPHKLLLNLLSKSFIDILQSKPIIRLEVDCMYFILVSIGKDIEQTFPQEMDQLFCIMRDVFLTNKVDKLLKPTLLQLIELRASEWKLPSEAMVYYCPGLC